MSFTEGCVIIDVRGQPHAPVQVRTRSTRGGEVALALKGLSVDSGLAETLIGSLYALCPQAHLAAWKGALAHALNRQYSADVRRIVYELMSEHLRFLAFDAPNAVGLTADSQVRRLGALRGLLAREFAQAEPDFAAIEAAMEPLIEYFVTGCPVRKFKALASLPDFEAWMMRGATAAARLFAQLWENVPCRPRTAVPHVPPYPTLAQANAWFEAGLDVSAPTLDGVAHQTSAESRCQDASLVTEIAEQYGCGVRISFAARLIDLMQYWATQHNPQRVLVCGSPAPGVGLSLVQCARGLLMTRVCAQGDQIVDVHIVAPTEWNFAAGSAAQCALERIDFESEVQFRLDAGWIIAAVDPCVPYRLELSFEDEPA